MPAYREVVPRLDRAAIRHRIERLDAPADLKATLAALVDTTIELGGKVIDIGRRILAFTFEFAKAYPNLTLGVVAALVLSYLVGSIPGLGAVLSPILTPLLLIIGIGLGALADLTDSSMRQRLSTLQAHFQALGVA